MGTSSAADSRSTVSTEGRFVPRSNRDRNPLSSPAAAASASTVRPFSKRMCRRRGPIVGLIFAGRGKLFSSKQENNGRNSFAQRRLGPLLPLGLHEHER